MSSMKLTRRAEKIGAACLPYRAVKLDGSGNIIPTTAETDDVYAVTCETSSDIVGDSIPCEYSDIVKLTVGAAVVKGARLMPQAAGAGKVITAVGASSKVLGEAMEPASGDGQRIHVRLYSNRRTVVGS